jgi:hypothetical protein
MSEIWNPSVNPERATDKTERYFGLFQYKRSCAGFFRTMPNGEFFSVGKKTEATVAGEIKSFVSSCPVAEQWN